jgi:hypothetical protein
MYGLNKSNARRKPCQKQLNSYVYATPSVAERLMRKDLRNKTEHRTRAAKAIAEFEAKFEKIVDMTSCMLFFLSESQYARTMLAGAGGCL